MIETRRPGEYVTGLRGGAVNSGHLQGLLQRIRVFHRRWTEEPDVMLAQQAGCDISPEQLLVLICNASRCPVHSRQEALWRLCGATPDEVAVAAQLTAAQTEPDQSQAEQELAGWFHDFLPHAKLAVLNTVEP